MELTEDQKKKLETLGRLNYPLNMVKSILAIKNENSEEFEKAFFDSESEVFKLFEKGRAIHDFEIDSGLIREADSGNIDALNRLEERLKERQDER